MKSFLLLAALALGPALLPDAARAAVYYVDNAGNDANPGTSTAAPWQTLARVNAATLAPGDSVLLRSGGLWREQLTVTASGAPGQPIRFGLYGGNIKPLISGADTVGPSAWHLISGPIYAAAVPALDAQAQVYLDGQHLEPARYPDSGWLITTAAAPDALHLVDATLGLDSAHLVGATVVARSSAWAVSSATVGAYDAASGIVTVSTALRAPMPAGYGFYLRGALWMLSQPGQWYYDAASGQLYVYAPAGDDPGAHTVEITRRAHCIYASAQSYLSFSSLSAADALGADVQLDGARSAVVSAVDTAGGSIGIAINGNTGTQVMGSSVQSALQVGIQSSGSGNLVVGNRVDGTGTVSAMPDATSYGITLAGSSSTAKGNTVTDSGYAGISFGGSSMLLQGNVIDGACQRLDDCGAIYTWSGDPSNTDGGSQVIGNIVSHAAGNIAGTAASHTLAVGIYLDLYTHDLLVQGNLIDDADYGLFLHDNYADTVTGNSVHGARQAALLLQNDAAPGYVHDLGVTGNVLESLGAGWTPLALKDFKDGAVAFGLYDHNLYCRAGSSYAVYQASTAGSLYAGLAAWQAATGQDLHSAEVAGTCPDGVAP